eukprot:3500917-Alexandrium_andersonii.AAC.1
MADCGLRRIAALAGLERIADCTLDPSRCKAPRQTATLTSGASERCAVSLFSAQVPNQPTTARIDGGPHSPKHESCAVGDFPAQIPIQPRTARI